MSFNPQHYLGECEIIDYRSSDVLRVARQLATSDFQQTARSCFEFVRDEIRHSGDCQLNPVTCRASDVLRHRTGYCYAKSHLLCALLRANSIPAGLCYQRLSVHGGAPPYCLHGLNGVYLPDFGWYRLDARGNGTGIDAQFCPPLERLAFSTLDADEFDFPKIYISPLSIVVDCLRSHTTWQAVAKNLPDTLDI